MTTAGVKVVPDLPICVRERLAVRLDPVSVFGSPVYSVFRCSVFWASPAARESVAMSWCRWG